MTIEQVLEIVISNLNGISVPRYLNHQIGEPIDTAVANLNACLDAIRAQESEKDPKEEPKEEEQNAEADT